MLMVCQVGQCDRVTGAVTYQATVGNDAAFALSFTEPRDGEVADLGYGMFRYTPHARVNAESDSFTVIADDGRGGSFDSLVTWVNDNQVPVAVARRGCGRPIRPPAPSPSHRISLTPTVIG